MKLDEYRKWVIDHDDRWNYPNNLTIQNLLHYHLALCEEAGEAGGQAKKFIRELKTDGAIYTSHGQNIYASRRLKVGIELVDVMIYFQKVLEQWSISSTEFDKFWEEKFGILHGRWDNRLVSDTTTCGYACGDETV